MAKFNDANTGISRKKRLFELVKRGSDDHTKSGKQKESAEPVVDLRVWQDLDPQAKKFRSYIFGVVADTESELIQSISNNVIRQANNYNAPLFNPFSGAKNYPTPSWSENPVGSHLYYLSGKPDFRSLQDQGVTLPTLSDVIRPNFNEEFAQKSERSLESMLNLVAAEIHVKIKYDETAANKIPAGASIPLEYLVENGGVCRHQSVAAIAVLQKLREDGYIRGSLRLVIGNMDGGEFANHAWVEHVDQSGQIWVIDPTNLKAEKSGEGYYKYAPLAPGISS